MKKIMRLALFLCFFTIQLFAGQKTVLVTGGAGFLGSHLCDRLIGLGHEVICLDNLYTGDMKNIQHLLSHPKFTFVNHNIIEPYDTDKHIDEIYNLACPASPPHYQKDSIFTLKTCFLGSLNMIQIALKNNAKIFQASTSEVYGDPLEHPQKESYWGHVNPIGLRSCYDEGKRCAETLFFDYHRQHNLRIKVVRIFNTYGPRMDKNDGRVVSNFIVQALQNKPLTVYGDGSQTRSFCYVDDLIDGFLALMESDDSITGPVNIGNPSEYTVKEFGEKIIGLTGSQSTLNFLPLPSDDPKMRHPDITQAKELLDWEPKVSVDEGLKRTIEYFKGRI